MNSVPMAPHQRSGPFLDGYMDNGLDLGGYPGMGEYHRIPGMTPDLQMQGYMPGEGPNEQHPPETFRTEYNGALQGVQSLLQLLYATTGIINFGGVAIKMTFKAIKFLGGGSLKVLGYIFNPKHFTRLIRVLFSNGGEPTNGLSAAFETSAEAGIDAATLGEGASKANKIFFILRLVSLIGKSYPHSYRVYLTTFVRCGYCILFEEKIRKHSEDNARKSQRTGNERRCRYGY